MRHVKAPAPVNKQASEFAIFLAGSIEMDKARRWQDELVKELGTLDDQFADGLVIMNPRRDHWDANLRQSIHEPAFKEQVDWELDALDWASLTAMWFEPGTQSPITLLELGLTAAAHCEDFQLVVGCPDGFWRKGNVEVVCDRYEIQLEHSWDAFAEAIKLKCEIR